MQVANRLGLIPAYFSSSRNFGIPLAQVISNGILTRTCTQIGPYYVIAIEDCGRLERVQLRGMKDPLYWPKEISHYEIYKSCTDCLHSTQWHHYEVRETKVEGGENVVDCGAAEGIFALSVAERAGKIAIFEPWNGFTESLNATFADRALICSQALGKNCHTAYLSGDSLYGTVNESKGTAISVTTLDEFRRTFGSVNYIKADVEGSEHDLLEGAKDLIYADKPKIAITAYHVGNDWEYMVKLVRRIVPTYKYRIKGLSYNGGTARPVMLHMWV
jgi:FkbM family methyltransferase